MTHHHDHHVQHDHHHHSESKLTFHEKAIKLIEHWIKHNQDHVQTYHEWIDKFQSHHMPEVAERLIEVAELTDKISIKFKSVMESIESKPEKE